MHTRLAALCAAGCLVALLAAPVQTHAQDLDEASRQVAEIEGQVDQLALVYLRPAQLQSTYTFASRLSEGQVRHMLGQYDAAAMVLVELVENPANRSAEGYDNALWLLADSLFLSRQFALARSYFEQLLDRGDPRRSVDAARRLLEVAFAMRDYSGLDGLFASLQSRLRGAIGPEVAYVRGKALYFQGRYGEAGGAFGSVTADSDLYDRSRYFVGTIAAREQRWADAESEFAAVLERVGAAEEDPEELADLARLALGRVFYEQQRWEDASAVYGQVPRTSTRYDDALYELAWTQIRREEFESAFNLLDILQVIARDRRLVPEAELLQGDLLMRLAQYDEAVLRFESVADEYQGVEEDLRAITTSSRSGEEYFEALVNPDEGALRIPPRAEPWFREDSTVATALLVVRDVAWLEEAIAQSRSVIEELDLVVNGQGGVNVFPQWREGFGRALELQRSLTDLNAAMLDSEREQVWPVMPADARAQYEALRAERAQLAEAYARTPRTFAELNDRATRVVDGLGESSIEVFRAEQDLAEMRGEIEALRRILAERRRQGGVDPNLSARWEAELARFEAAVDAHEDEASDFRERIRQRQIQVGVGDEVGRAEQQLRERYMAAVAAEAAALRPYRSGASVGGRYFDGVDEVRTRSAAIDASLAEFFASMDRLVLEALASVRTTLDQERAALDLHEQRLDTLRRESDRVAGEVAFRAVVATHARFSDLTLRANLGIIDVAWEQKEVLSRQLDDLFTERNEALRVLDADFAELLDDR